MLEETEATDPLRSLPEELLTERAATNDLGSQLLHGKAKSFSFVGRVYRRVRRKLSKHRREYLVEEQHEADKAVEARKMELINDPVYMSAEPKQKPTLESFILRYSAVMQTVPP